MNVLKVDMKLKGMTKQNERKLLHKLKVRYVHIFTSESIEPATVSNSRKKLLSKKKCIDSNYSRQAFP